MNTSCGPAVPGGLVNLYKPCGRTSAQYAYRLRRVFGIRKIGHAGTLDPFADGVLLACVGSATKWVEKLMGLPKMYRTTLRLGVTNATLDSELPFDPVPGAVRPSQAQIEAALLNFRGWIDQTPPQYSAVKVGGQSSHERARRGETVILAPKRVYVEYARLLTYAWPSMDLEIACGRGTYIRAIARDLGELLACGACCERLTRTAVGPFRMEDGVNLDEADDHATKAALLPVEQLRELLGP